MNERFAFQNQIEHNNLRVTGTGTPDTTKWEYGTNIQRDALASHIGHYSRMIYFATAENETTFRLRHQMLLKMVQPCGPPPEKNKKGEF